MSDDNTNIFSGESEDSEDSEESEESKEEWGGEIQNEIIASIPETQSTQLLRVSQNLTRIRKRDEIFPIFSSTKFFRNIDGKRIDRVHLYSYLALKSGNEFYFTEEDGKNILLNERLEPNRLIRNIISRVPYRMSERLLYLAKFDSEEEEEDDEEKRYSGILKELVYEGYCKEWRLRFAFKKLLVCWRIYKMNKSYEKVVDPITLSYAEKEVVIYDWDNKKKCIFDAKSIATLIETKLLYHEYGFPVPMYPRNPNNNVEFSYKQMISLYYQLKRQGELRWAFTTLREYNFNKNRWHMYHKSALTMNSIKTNIYLLDSVDSRELLLDFIFAKMDELECDYNNNVIYNIYSIAMVSVPNHWYLENLKSLAISHYEGNHFGQNRTKIINSACIKVFKQHNKFITDLKNKGIIS